MPTAVAAVSRMIEEAKMRVLEADAEIKLALSTRAEMQQLHLKLAAAEREFIDKYTDLGKVFRIGLCSPKERCRMNRSNSVAGSVTDAQKIFQNLFLFY
uniref:SWIRM-assoc_1 domain-containing protein n=1 Tax=Ascaris lumbricoides TaxID=6252 RepID=A0A0M3I6W3_ASCLU